MPEKFEPYSYEKAREEGEKLQAKVKSGEARDYEEAEQMVEAEKELSPEIIEKVMDKVRDINTFGIALHTLGVNYFRYQEKYPEGFKAVLKEGVLGLSHGVKNEILQSSETLPQRKIVWKAALRGRKESQPIFFNILGRTTDDAYESRRFSDSYWIRSDNGPDTSITILFDLSKYKDAVGNKEQYMKSLQQLKDGGSKNPEKDFIRMNEGRPGTYFPAYGEITRSGFDKNGLVRGWHDNGFTLFSRIAPRLFQGIVVKSFRKTPLLPSEYEKRISDHLRKDLEQEKRIHPGWSLEQEAEYIAKHEQHLRSVSKLKFKDIQEETDVKVLQAEAERLANQMLDAYQDKENLILPVYDIDGDLLWPKRMSYEEVKQMVAERDKKKAD